MAGFQQPAITRFQPNEVRVRGHGVADLMGGVSFGAAVILILNGELPGARARTIG